MVYLKLQWRANPLFHQHAIEYYLKKISTLLHRKQPQFNELDTEKTGDTTNKLSLQLSEEYFTLERELVIA